MKEEINLSARPWANPASDDLGAHLSLSPLRSLPLATAHGRPTNGSPRPGATPSDLSTETLYDRASGEWARKEPILLSDYTARPFLMDWCDPIKELDVLDLGCGEGYFARNLKVRGARSVHGIDLSSKMIDQAREEEAREHLGISYEAGDATDLRHLGDQSFDRVVAVFLFNYLDREQTLQAMQAVARVLKPGGSFVFAVPHPGLPFILEESPPFYFSPGGHGYFSGRDRLFEGEIYRRDGVAVPVRSVHKTFTDYFRCLRDAGFTAMPEVEELGVTEEMVTFDPDFFSPLLDQPLHLAFRLEKT